MPRSKIRPGSRKVTEHRHTRTVGEVEGCGCTARVFVPMNAPTCTVCGVLADFPRGGFVISTAIRAGSVSSLAYGCPCGAPEVRVPAYVR